MKRIVVVFLALILTVSLSGCKSDAVKDVEKKIDSIGVVSLSSLEILEEVERAYNGLSEKEKQQVENVNVLTNARQQYDFLKKEDDERYKPIPLTISNVNDYLDISISTRNGNAERKYDGSYYYVGIYADVNIKGASPNFNYNNVSLTIKITGFCFDFLNDILDIEKEFTIKCGKGGNASESVLLTTDFVSNRQSFDGFEITAVSGEVVPVR